MTARNRAPWVLAFALCAAVIAAGVTKAVLDSRAALLEAEALWDDDDLAEPSRVNWPPDPDLTRRVTR